MEKKARTKALLATLAKNGYSLKDLIELLDQIPENEPVERRVALIIQGMGIPSKVKGHYYLQEAVCLAYHDNMLIKHITTKLYPLVAQKYGATPSQVERNIRYAIDLIWIEGDRDYAKKVMGVNGLYKPTNGNAIAGIVEYLQMEEQKM